MNLKLEQRLGYEPNEYDVPIDQIVRSNDLQPRGKIDEATVRRYAKHMELGHEFPPVVLHKVDNLLYLADGFHRVAAAETNGDSHIFATITESSMESAKGTAALANLKHGLAMTPKQIRKGAFRLYVEGRLYRAGRKYKSYAMMAEDLGVAHGTVYNWMRSDYPELAARIGGRGDQAYNTEWHQQQQESAEDRLTRELWEHQEAALRLIPGLSEERRAEAVREIHRRITAVLESLKHIPELAPQVEEADDF